MIKLNINKIDNKVLEQCRNIAEDSKYETAPVRIYEDIRNAFCIAKSVEDIVSMGFPLDLVEAIKKEVF